MYVNRLPIFGVCARMMPLSVSDELYFLKITLTFELVIFPPDSKFAFSFGMYITLVSVIGTARSWCEGSDVIEMCMVPHWLAVNVLLLAVSIVTGGMSCNDVNSSCFPERWLEVADSISQV